MQVGFSKVTYGFKRNKKKSFQSALNTDSPPLSVFFPTIGFKAGPSEKAWPLEGRSIKMRNQDGTTSIRLPLFNGNNLIFWKTRMRSYLQSLGANLWAIVEGGYQYPATVPTDPMERKNYESNAKAVNAITGSLTESKFVKFMQLNIAKEMWDKIILSYEGDAKVKSSKLQTL